METFNYKMILMYDGTLFSGWQIQPNGISVQQSIQEAIFHIIKEHVNVVGSGRTDAGVHAMGQTAHFHCSRELNLYKFQHSLNCLLPDTISVKHIERVSPLFHARYSALRKTYRYHVNINKFESPFRHLYSWHFMEKGDISLLKKAAPRFVGTHDFTSFANDSHLGTAGRNPVRTLYRLDISDHEGEIVLEFEANGFLYKMVRNITGTLFHIVNGRIKLEALDSIFEAKDRTKAGPTAPPQGLFLFKVDYPPSQ